MRLKLLGWPLDTIMAMPDPQQLKNCWWGQKLTPPSIASRPRTIKPSKSISNIWTTIGLPAAAHASAENIQEGSRPCCTADRETFQLSLVCLRRQSSTLAAPLTLRLNTPRRTQAHAGRQIRRITQKIRHLSKHRQVVIARAAGRASRTSRHG